jgi:hypothetical protein
MPVINGVGRSDHTPFKQEHFRSFLVEHTSTCRVIQGKYSWHPWEYVYMDLFSGPGYDPADETLDGSPVIALERLKAIGFPFRAHLFESDGRNAFRLKETLRSRGLWVDGSVFIHHGRFQDRINLAVADLGRRRAWRVGLVYADPNSLTPKDTAVFDVMAALSAYETTKRLDLLIHTQATSYKRVRRAAELGRPGFERYASVPCLEDQIRRVGKPLRIGRPDDQHQWTFLLFSNFRDEGFGRSQGWYSADSTRGRHWLDKITLTVSEIGGRAPRGHLFDPW